MKRLTIAIDCDGTWTSDSEMWRNFYLTTHSYGHSVIMVTGRPYWSDDMARFNIPKEMVVIYAAGELKETAARKAGHKVDIWIDDMPGTVQDCKILNIEGELP